MSQQHEYIYYEFEKTTSNCGEERTSIMYGIIQGWKTKCKKPLEAAQLLLPIIAEKSKTIQKDGNTYKFIINKKQSGKQYTYKGYYTNNDYLKISIARQCRIKK